MATNFLIASEIILVHALVVGPVVGKVTHNYVESSNPMESPSYRLSTHGNTFLPEDIKILSKLAMFRSKLRNQGKVSPKLNLPASSTITGVPQTNKSVFCSFCKMMLSNHSKLTAAIDDSFYVDKNIFSFYARKDKNSLYQSCFHRCI